MSEEIGEDEVQAALEASNAKDAAEWVAAEKSAQNIELSSLRNGNAPFPEEERRRYVCYDAADGGICWARIKCEGRVNTQKGEKEVFVVSERVNRYRRTDDTGRYRKFYDVRNEQCVGDGSEDDPDADIWLEARHISGDTIVYKDSIDLERDVVYLDGAMGSLTSDEAFMALLDGRKFVGELGARDDSGMRALEVGIRMLAGDREGAEVLARRMKEERG